MALNIIKHGVLKDIKHTPHEIKKGIFEPIYNFIDFRLPSGNLWSKLNLGGTTPVDKGDYYYWGGTIGAHESQINTCNFDQYNPEIQSYLCTSEQLKIDGIIDETYHLVDKNNPCLQFNDQSYIPSKEDWEELLLYCDFDWTEVSYFDFETFETYPGKGYKVTRKRSMPIDDPDSFNWDTSIFLPVTGFARKSNLENTKNGYYWTNFAEPGTHNSFHLSFDEIKKDISVRQNYRFFGMAIRPVFSMRKAATDKKFGMVKLSERDWELEKPYQGKIGRNPQGTVYAINAYTKSEDDRKKEKKEQEKNPDIFKPQPNYAIPGTVALCYEQKWYDKPANGYFVNPVTDSEYLIPDVFSLKVNFTAEEMEGMTAEEIEQIIADRIALKQYGFVPRLYEETIKHIAVPHWEVAWRLNGYMYAQKIKNTDYIQKEDEPDDYEPVGDEQPKLFEVGSVAKDLYGFVYFKDVIETKPHELTRIVYGDITYDADNEKLYEQMGMKLQMNAGTLFVKSYDPETGDFIEKKNFACRGLLPAIYGGEDYYNDPASATKYAKKTIPGLYTEIYGKEYTKYIDQLENNWKGLTSKYSTSKQKGIIKELYEKNKGLVDKVKALQEKVNALIDVISSFSGNSSSSQYVLTDIDYDGEGHVTDYDGETIYFATGSASMNKSNLPSKFTADEMK